MRHPAGGDVVAPLELRRALGLEDRHKVASLLTRRRVASLLTRRTLASPSNSECQRLMAVLAEGPYLRGRRGQRPEPWQLRQWLGIAPAIERVFLLRRDRSLRQNSIIPSLPCFGSLPRLAAQLGAIAGGAHKRAMPVGRTGRGARSLADLRVAG